MYFGTKILLLGKEQGMSFDVILSACHLINNPRKPLKMPSLWLDILIVIWKIKKRSYIGT